MNSALTALIGALTSLAGWMAIWIATGVRFPSWNALWTVVGVIVVGFGSNIIVQGLL